MIPKIAVILFFLLLAGISNGVHDTLQHHYGSSIFRTWTDSRQQFWNPEISWRNKYKKDDTGNLVRPLRPAFPGSTTALVFVTDGWHLTKTLYHGALRICLILALSLAIRLHNKQHWNIALWVLAWFVLAGIQAVGFHIMSWLLV